MPEESRQIGSDVEFIARRTQLLRGQADAVPEVRKLAARPGSDVRPRGQDHDHGRPVAAIRQGRSA
jgi:hypothetical protein